MNDDEELGESYLIEDEYQVKEQAATLVAAKRRKEPPVVEKAKKKRKRRSIREERSPRDWDHDDWNEWYKSLLDVDLSATIVDSVDLNVQGKRIAVLVVCGSALRCAALAKLLKTHGHVAKLFGKHLKQDDQIALLKKRPLFAVGTPSRLLTLASHLRLAPSAVVLVDTDPDVKGYTPFTLPDAKFPLARLIGMLLESHPDLRLAANTLS